MQAMAARRQLGAALLMALLAPAAARVKLSASSTASPVQKVLQLLTDLEAKILREGEAAQKTYAKFTEWCEDRNANLGFEIKTAKAKAAGLEAAIGKAASEIAALGASIEETAAAVASSEADLKAASAIRQQEEADFATQEKEVTEVVDMLTRAIGIIEREMKKGQASMLQLSNMPSFVQAFSAMVEASMLTSQDAVKLTALVQQSQAEVDGDGADGLGAPDAAVYGSHSSGLVETLQGLLDKAEDQLDAARKDETNSKHHFEMLKQSLDDEVKFGDADLDKDKKDAALQTEAKATAEGDLKVTKADLAEGEQTQSTLKQDCMTESQDFESEVKSRGEELRALAEAQKMLRAMAGGADGLTYGLGQVSFLQVGDHHQMSGLRTGADLANYEAVRLVRNLAEQYHSDALTQLSRRMASVMRVGASSGNDPFGKVKALIRDMITTLEKDTQADASHKAYCDKEMGETDLKKVQKDAALDKLSTQIDSMASKSAQLKQEVAATNAALAQLAKAQAELTQIRSEEKAEFKANKPEMEQGLEGVKMALNVLREYYAKEGKAHIAAEGSGTGIIGLLEVVESDFTRLLAEMMAAETTAQAEYDRTSRANEIDRATQETSVGHLTREFKQLDAAVAEATGDREGVQSELQAILEYQAKLTEMCVAKPEAYSERQERREAEIDGLKQALKILEEEVVLRPWPRERGPGGWGARGRCTAECS